MEGWEVRITGINLAAFPKAQTRDEQTLVLPYPPSNNSYYRHVGAKVLISAKGRAYRKAVAQAIALNNGKAMAPGRYGVELTVHREDRRRCDLDNLCKGLFDSLTEAGVWEDDSLVDDLRIIRGGVKKPGECVVHIWRIGGVE